MSAPAEHPKACALATLKELAEAMEGQENFSTSWPIYAVQREALVPTDENYADDIHWYKADDWERVSETRELRLEALYESYRRTQGELEGRWSVRRVCVLRQWMIESVHLTHAEASAHAARLHRDHDGYRHRVYTMSAHASPSIRALLTALRDLAGVSLPGVPEPTP